MFPALFLDRDGVIIKNRRGYVRTWEDVAFFPHALEALVRMRTGAFKIVVVTNQSQVGRGITSLAAAEEVNRRFLEQVEAAGGRIDGIFMCPHAPEDRCDCRKPRPGLILQAKQALNLDLSRSILIGDALEDIMAGENAGVPHRVLVLTGRGRAQNRLPAARTLKPYQVRRSLAAALEKLPESLFSGIVT
ncbi:MAG: HAD family hydrolase [Chloroflexi bacterium]|nr:HAD family hydrolase [Chloroflexota bacterium]